MSNKRVFKGEVWVADLGKECVGSEQSGQRPVCIIQNDVGNKYSPTTIVAMITSKDKTDIPTHMEIELYKPSTIMLEQIRTIDKSRLVHKVCNLTEEQINELNNKLKISLAC